MMVTQQLEVAAPSGTGFGGWKHLNAMALELWHYKKADMVIAHNFFDNACMPMSQNFKRSAVHETSFDESMKSRDACIALMGRATIKMPAEPSQLEHRPSIAPAHLEQQPQKQGFMHMSIQPTHAPKNFHLHHWRRRKRTWNIMEVTLRSISNGPRSSDLLQVFLGNQFIRLDLR